MKNKIEKKKCMCVGIATQTQMKIPHTPCNRYRKNVTQRMWRPLCFHFFPNESKNELKK